MFPARLPASRRMRLCVHFLFLWSMEIGTFLGGGGESPAEFGLGGPDCRDESFSVKDQLLGEPGGEMTESGTSSMTSLSVVRDWCWLAALATAPVSARGNMVVVRGGVLTAVTLQAVMLLPLLLALLPELQLVQVRWPLLPAE